MKSLFFISCNRSGQRLPLRTMPADTLGGRGGSDDLLWWEWQACCQSSGVDRSAIALQIMGWKCSILSHRQQSGHKGCKNKGPGKSRAPETEGGLVQPSVVQ